jgi:hypothetical protein
LAGALFDGGFFINDGFSGIAIFVAFGLAVDATGCADCTGRPTVPAAVDLA